MADEKDNETKWAKGAKTYRFMRIRSGKARGRAFDLKEKGADRMIMLFRKGVYGDRLARPMKRVDGDRREELAEQAEFARLPTVTKIRVLKMKRADLEEDLRRMEYTTSQIARTFHMPDILRKLDEINKEIRRLEEEAEEEI
jgi:hypothetical protein